MTTTTTGHLFQGFLSSQGENQLWKLIASRPFLRLFPSAFRKSIPFLNLHEKQNAFKSRENQLCESTFIISCKHLTVHIYSRIPTCLKVLVITLNRWYMLHCECSYFFLNIKKKLHTKLRILKKSKNWVI
jgi:hypothetical protein